MITAANTIGGAGKIARAKPHVAEKVGAALLKVETATYQTAECRNVALGHTVAALDLFFEHIRNAQPVLAFVERQLRNSRNAVRRKATAFLKKHSPSPQPGRPTNRLSAKEFMKTKRTSSAVGAGRRNSQDTKAVRSTQTDLPRDLADALHAAKLGDFFSACTAAHRREYLKWIDEAKRPETRRARIAKAMTMLADKRAAEDARVKRTA